MKKLQSWTWKPSYILNHNAVTALSQNIKAGASTGNKSFNNLHSDTWWSRVEVKLEIVLRIIPTLLESRCSVNEGSDWAVGGWGRRRVGQVWGRWRVGQALARYRHLSHICLDTRQHVAKFYEWRLLSEPLSTRQNTASFLPFQYAIIWTRGTKTSDRRWVTSLKDDAWT